MIIFFSAAPALANGEEVSVKLYRVPLVIALAVIITLAAAPFLYRRTLRKKSKTGGKLTTFLMSDPETREILMSRNQPPQEPEQGRRESD